MIEKSLVVVEETDKTDSPWMFEPCWYFRAVGCWILSVTSDSDPNSGCPFSDYIRIAPFVRAFFLVIFCVGGVVIIIAPNDASFSIEELLNYRYILERKKDLQNAQ